MFIQVLQKVFRKPAYLFTALSVSIIIFAFALWFPNLSLIVSIMDHPGISLSQKLDLPLSLLGSIATNFTLLSASYTIAIAILFGIDISLIIYFLRRRIAEVKQAGIGTSFFGITSGILGMGCAACGSFLLTSILPIFGASWVLSHLPLAGGEFGILGVILLTVSIVLTAKKIQDPAVCLP